MAAAAGYSPLPLSEQTIKGYNASNTHDATEHKSQSKTTHLIFTWVTLFVSLSINTALLCRESGLYHLQAVPTLSTYAKLARDQPTARNYTSIYTNPDRAASDAAWQKLVRETEVGWVALEDKYSESIGLPHSVRWPWDDTKGIYVLSAAHELHCVYVLRTFINNANDGEPFKYKHPHALHCIEVMRELVMCNADDYPLYKGALNAAAGQANPRAGYGTIKMCRDWNKLVAWAEDRAACWQEEDEENLEDKFKSCPGGRKPWEGSHA